MTEYRIKRHAVRAEELLDIALYLDTSAELYREAGTQMNRVRAVACNDVALAARSLAKKIKGKV